MGMNRFSKSFACAKRVCISLGYISINFEKISYVISYTIYVCVCVYVYIYVCMYIHLMSRYR